MEQLASYSMPGYNFTVWFFRLLLLMAITIIVLVLTLHISETISIKEGEIVALNPQADYKAPFEAQVVKINVKEGQAVKAGDTLLVMRNADYPAQQATTKTEIEYLEKKIQSFGMLENAIQKKKLAIDQAAELAEKKYQLDINQLLSDMKTLDQQYDYQQQRLSSANEKYAGDSILYKKDMLSRYEYNNTKDMSLTLKENLTSVESQRHRQLSEKNIVYNNFTKEQNALLLGKVQLDENEQSLKQAKNDYQSQLAQAGEALKKIEADLNKQTILANSPGVVNYLFNTKESSNLINKGELLITIVPQTISYYAKLIVAEKDMPYIKTGLITRLKFDAYHQFENGLINGKVSYVAERKESEKFYALIQLNEKNDWRLKPGYMVYGEIVVGRMPLYKYFLKKLFRQEKT